MSSIIVSGSLYTEADGRRVTMFLDFLGYGNHVELYSEEISRGGEGLGVSSPAMGRAGIGANSGCQNTPQAFSHVTLISAAFNLDRALAGGGEP